MKTACILRFIGDCLGMLLFVALVAGAMLAPTGIFENLFK